MDQQEELNKKWEEYRRTESHSGRAFILSDSDTYQKMTVTTNLAGSYNDFSDGPKNDTNNWERKKESETKWGEWRIAT